MAITVQELIDKKAQIEAKKNETYDIKTSIGTLTVAKPSRSLVADSLDISDAGASDRYLILHSVIAPNLSDPNLQETYNCMEPTDIIDRLFDSGEITAISKQILSIAGYGRNIEVELHKEIKN